MALRAALRLIDQASCVQFTRPPTVFLPHTVRSVVHRFEESIAGRPYLIEVAAVADDRWRACIVRLPGVPSALMPFYGPTPDEAADRLRRWLTRAYERVTPRS